MRISTILTVAALCAARLAAATDGTPDPAFGYHGTSYFGWDSHPSGQVPNDQARSLLVQPDDKVIVVGNIGDSDAYGGGLAIGIGRLLPNGQFDTSFGDGGETVIHGSSVHFIQAYSACDAAE